MRPREAIKRRTKPCSAHGRPARLRPAWTCALLIVSLSAVGAGCQAPLGADEAPPSNSGPQRVASAEGGGGDANVNVVALNGLTLTVPADWAARGALSTARQAEFVVPGATPDAEAAGFVVYHFGPDGAGRIQANFDRWASQFEQPDGADSLSRAQTLEHTVDGMRVSMMDLDGTYVAETSPGSGERVNLPDYALRAAIVNTAAGPYYFKLTGPAAVLARWDDAFDTMIVTMRASALDATTPTGERHP